MAVSVETVNKITRGKTILLAQEIEFAKVLAGNNKTLRDREIKKLKKWLIARSKGKCEFTDDDFLRIWKGLFYCMWMADKPLVQEELAETISNLIHCLAKTKLAISFIRCFFRTMILEWYGIDLFRYDKFMMLVRRFLRQTFKFCRNYEWKEEVVTGVCSAFNTTVLSSSKDRLNEPPLSLVTHFCEIYLQELAKVGKEKIPVEVVTQFVEPFISLLSVEEKGTLRDKVVKDVFHYLMKQSDAAFEFKAKWEAWQSAGCPGQSWEDMERVESEEEEEDMDCEDHSEKEMFENGPLDPRAGSVDVELPQILFDSRGIAEAFQRTIGSCTSKKNKKTLNYLAMKFLELAEGKYPLAKEEEKTELTIPKIKNFKLKNHIYKAIYRLNTFEKKLEKRKRGKKHRRKNDKKQKMVDAESSKDGTNEMSDAVTISPERVCSVLLEDCTSKINNVDDHLKCTSRKRKRSTSGDSSDVEPKLKIKREEIVNGENTNRNGLNNSALSQDRLLSDVEPKLKMKKEKADRNSLSNSTPLMKKKKLYSGDWAVSDVTNEDSKNEATPRNSINKKSVQLSSNKKVNIALNMNCSQDLRQYQMAVKRSPAIPFDGNKHPGQGVLKPSVVGSRINPFYNLRTRKLLDD
ncbi:hypothetical protein L9F63_013179 [Diploptera punctata]|uniref:Ribosomal RNA processing protein 1 homolog n=1 Tax=Diploptera punctata TaxID=6984 RepID=A0AAD8AAS8_DIPPU|nr:hypothetical protein L9F63_013179 [Diploptera punctata]